VNCRRRGFRALPIGLCPLCWDNTYYWCCDSYSTPLISQVWFKKKSVWNMPVGTSNSPCFGYKRRLQQCTNKVWWLVGKAHQTVVQKYRVWIRISPQPTADCHLQVGFHLRWYLAIGCPLGGDRGKKFMKRFYGPPDKKFFGLQIALILLAHVVHTTLLAY
jgi:hypothetical protein